MSYGTWLSTATWYIWPIGSDTRWMLRPCCVVMLSPPSCVITKRSGFFGSHQMSWLSPPHGRLVERQRRRRVDWKNELSETSTSSSFAGETARRM